MKRLIVCCDGTWQDLDQRYPNNVVKMTQAIQPTARSNIPQIVYYDEGIGASQGIKLTELIEKIGGGALGWGIDHKIQSAYRFLCLNYEPGDEIYLFGFSRGAYTVRSLAGLIHNSGLLRRDNLRLLSKAYELYRNKAADATPNSPTALQFRQRYGIDYCPPKSLPAIDQGRVSIKALGCWDTVCSLGVPDVVAWLNLDQTLRKRYEFFDHKVNRLVEFAFHAAAIDEMRSAYNLTPMEPSPDRDASQITQAWFPGYHGCVGGGVEAVRGLSDAALLWMMEQVQPLGLALDSQTIEYGIRTDYRTPFDNRPTGIYRNMATVLRPVTGGFGALHDSVKQRWQNPDMGYRPKNLDAFRELLNAWGLSTPRRELAPSAP